MFDRRQAVPHAQLGQVAPLYAPAILTGTFIALRSAMDIAAGDFASPPCATTTVVSTPQSTTTKRS
jgi:hypothetical protein